MKTVLSTKTLLPEQKELLHNSGVQLEEYNALEIDFLEVSIPLDHQYYIFTSQNAVKAFLQQTQGRNRSHYYAFCVGEKTKALLQKKGVKVLKMAENAANLARFITKHRQNESFLFVCGIPKREELPRILAKKKVSFIAVEVYKARRVYKKFDRQFEGILFFSPGGIQSYTTENTIGNSWAFCIGDTTSHEAKRHTSQIVTSPKSTVEHVLARAIQTLKSSNWYASLNTFQDLNLQAFERPKRIELSPFYEVANFVEHWVANFEEHWNKPCNASLVFRTPMV